MIDAINNNKELPFELKGMGIYYVGPSPSKEGANNRVLLDLQQVIEWMI